MRPNLISHGPRVAGHFWARVLRGVPRTSWQSAAGRRRCAMQLEQELHTSRCDTNTGECAAPLDPLAWLGPIRIAYLAQLSKVGLPQATVRAAVPSSHAAARTRWRGAGAGGAQSQAQASATDAIAPTAGVRGRCGGNGGSVACGDAPEACGGATSYLTAAVRAIRTGG